MDHVDEINGRFVQLDELGLTEVDYYLVAKLIERFADRKVYVLRVNRGSAHSVKIVAKPSRLFPFFIKIGDTKQIEQEHRGDQLLRLRVPPLSIPPLEDFQTHRERAALMYRYITGGRVNELVDRLDVHLGKIMEDKGDALLLEIFDVVLRKCHWLDGDFEMRQINLPDLPSPEDGVDPTSWQTVMKLYLRSREKAAHCKAPHGIIHGDLTPKNVLVTRHNSPVLIDFTMSQPNGCVYFDYCKLETLLQFQMDDRVSDKFWADSERIYSSDLLILPRSNQGIARYIHTIRRTLWKACLSKSVGLSNADIDCGYRAQILYYLGCFYAKAGNSATMRQKAFEEIQNLSDATRH